MNKPLQNCPQCGANLTLDDLRGTNCPYCRTALPHHARAAEQAALVNQMLAQQGVNYQVPYQYGAAPPPVQMGPGMAQPGAIPVMPPYVAHQVQQSVDAAGKAVATSVIVSIVVALVVIVLMFVLGIAAFFFVRF